SALVSLVAILAFGSAYGILGVFIAVPLAAVVQVVLDHFVLDTVPEVPAAEAPPLATLRSHAPPLRHRIRLRLPGRDLRLGLDPAAREEVVDAVDQQLEEAVERIAGLIHQAQSAGRATDSEERSGILAALQGALQRLESAVARVDAVPGAKGDDAGEALPLDELERATTQAEKAIAGAEAAVSPTADAPPRTVRRLDRA